MKRVLTAVVIIGIGAGVFFFRRAEDAPVKPNPKPLAVAPAAVPESRLIVPSPAIAPVEALPSETEERRAERIKRFGDIPWEKWVKVQTIVSDYVALQEKSLREINRFNNASTIWEVFDLLKQERRGDLAAAGLTPDEITECELHVFGATLLNTFSSLEGVEITPAEQRAIYRATDWGDRDVNQRGRPQGEEIAIRERIGLAKYDQVRAILGPERAAVFYSIQPEYRSFASLAKELGQSETLADQLWRIRAESLIRSGELQVSSSDRAAYEQQSSVLNVEIRSRVVGLVGEDAIEKNPAAFEHWLRPKPKAPTTPAAP